MQYDEEVFHPRPDEKRQHPSQRALEQAGKEAIVFLCTCSTSGSTMLKLMKVSLTVNIIDEGGHSAEIDTLTSIVTASKLASRNRTHIVIAGDHHQLSPVVVSQHDVSRFLRMPTFKFKIPIWKQARSLFERLYDHCRAPKSWLVQHYRANPHLGAIQMRYMYKDVVEHPRNIAAYEVSFNNPATPDSFAPFTFVDTAMCKYRYERGSGLGSYTNELEAKEMDGILKKLFRVKGDVDLTDEVFVTVPYKSQVQFLRDYLQKFGHFMDIYRNARVQVEKIDSLQGMERRVVIVSMTRSNIRGDVGFLTDGRQINVGTSRARNLLVLIGDSSTVINSPMVMDLWKAANSEMPGSRVVFSKPARGMEDHIQVREVRDRTEKILRRRDGYHLRRR